MSTKNRRPSLVDRNTLSSSSGSHGKFIPPHLARKRPPLGNLTNQKNFDSRNVARCSAVASGTTVQCSGKVAKAKKDSSACKGRAGISENSWPAISKFKSIGVSKGDKPFRSETASSSSTRHAPCSTAFSPSPSVAVSLDETMSTCDSFKSPEVEYLDNMDVSEAVALERKALSTLCISGQVGTAGKMINEGVQAKMEADKKTVNVDNNFSDPQFCATIACDIYKHLRASEVKKRPSTDFMETIQKDINPSMRGILIDWLVEVAEEYRLVPDTLFLTVNYIDRYLSGNPMDKQRLQLLGVACMMIASKYEEICAPQVEEFCYITDNTYFRDEVLQMESMVLNYLKFEMTAPTIKCFLRRFIRAAQVSGVAPSLQLECLANYIAELSLIEYTMLRYAPSLIAAAAIFLAKYIFFPSKRPWNGTLQHYTHYQPGDLYECVVGLQQLYCNSHRCTLPAVREKYSQHKYKFVAKKQCPPSIPLEFFCNEGST